MTHVFISYVREDQQSVDRLARDLAEHRIEVWLDREKIKPGERWRDAIRKAIRSGDYFIACFSHSSKTRGKTYMNHELALAIEELSSHPTDRTWFIPVVLAGGEIPDRRLLGGETLHDLQYVDLTDDWDAGVLRIVNVIGSAALREPEERADRIQALIQKLDNLMEQERYAEELARKGWGAGLPHYQAGTLGAGNNRFGYCMGDAHGKLTLCGSRFL